MARRTPGHPEYTARASDGARLVFSPEIAKTLGMSQDAELRVVLKRDRIEVFPNIHSLGRLYIEPTSLCNLSCRTCIRNAWHEQMGDMDTGLFDRLADQLAAFTGLKSVMFGGFGEPLFHKDISHMVRRIKALGLGTEITTNGTLLTEDMQKGLVDAGLDILWVSIDGAQKDSFEGVRAGADFGNVVENLHKLKALNATARHPIEVGVAFVVMKSNVVDLPGILTLAERLNAKRISVSNVLPYTEEMQDQMLYRNVPGQWSSDIAVSLPLMDRDNLTNPILSRMFVPNRNVSVLSSWVGTETNSCRFIRERCTFIRWDGTVSPCMGLLHSYTTYLPVSHARRRVTGYTLGDLRTERLKSIWDSEEYRQFRERVAAFEFSPCSSCGGCEYSEENQEDCTGNKFPTCGGCLWAQGVIQCP